MQLTTNRFDFRSLVLSHGWFSLPPWRWSSKSNTLSRPFRTPANGTIDARISVRRSHNKTIVLFRPHDNCRVTLESRQSLRNQIRRILCLDIDYSEFQNSCSDDSLLRFVYENKCGGMLRCPTAFEDLLKTVCTTNCNWRNTKTMCQSLCAINDGDFPTPDILLQYSPSSLSQKVPLGYRTATVLQAARIFSQDCSQLDEWAEQGDIESIKHFLGQIRGVGPYSINHMLVLLGHYAEIPVDSEVLNYVSRTHFKGRSIGPAQAVKPFSKHGAYKFLAYKFSRIARQKNYVG